MESQLWASWPVGFSLWTDKDSQSRWLLEANPQSKCCAKCCLSLGQSRGHVVACPAPSCSPLCLWAGGSHVTYHLLFPATCCCQTPSHPSHLLLDTDTVLWKLPAACNFILGPSTFPRILECCWANGSVLRNHLPESSLQPKTDGTGGAALGLLASPWVTARRASYL